MQAEESGAWMGYCARSLHLLILAAPPSPSPSHAPSPAPVQSRARAGGGKWGGAWCSRARSQLAPRDFFAAGPVVQFGAKYGRVKVGGVECGHNQSRVQLGIFLGGRGGKG